MIPGLISGAIAGYIASKLVDGEGKGCLFNLFIGWLGGLFGDWLFGSMGMLWHESHPWFGAMLGSVILLLIFNLISPRQHRSGGSGNGSHSAYGSYSEPRHYQYEDGDDTPDEQ